MRPFPRHLPGRLFAASFALLIAAAAAGSPQRSDTDPWPAFRGPTANGSAAGDLLQTSADFGLQVAWVRPLGSGYSGISVGADMVVTMFADGAEDVLVALDPDTGEERWRVAAGPTYRGHDGSFDGPTSTPLIHQGSVIALSPRGRLMAVDREGGVEWSVDLVEKYGARLPDYGFATSPLVQDGTLVVQIGAPGAAVAGFDPASGALRWTSGDDAVTYQSPIPVTVGGRRQVLATGLTELLGIDASTGEQLWRIAHGGDGFVGAQSLVPVPAGDNRLFLSFKDMSSTAITLDPADATENGARLWETNTIRNSYAVPVYRDGFVYGFSSRFLTAVDARTGVAAWKSRAPGDGFATLSGADLVISTKDGGLHIAAASPTGYHEKASIQVFDDLVWTPPSLGPRSVYMRSMSSIARVNIVAAAQFGDGVTYTRGTAPAASTLAAVVARVEAADGTAAKSEIIDAYLDAQQRFPIVEEPDLVHFAYRGPGADLALAGDIIGARQEAPMHRLAGTDFFYYSAHLEPDARVNYRFVRDFEAILDPRNDRQTMTEVYTDEMEVAQDGSSTPMSVLTMPDWRAPAHLADPHDDTPRGRLEHRSIETRLLAPQLDVQVYLPPGYDDTDERYPVAYYHGGFEVLPHGDIPKSLDNLIAAGQRPLIAVFIFAAPNIKLVVPGIGNADVYTRMWAEELVPYVDANFRTIATPDGRANIGAGWFSYAAMYVTFKRPGVAAKLGIQTVVMNDSRRVPLENLVTTSAEQPLDMYIEWGSHDAQTPQENWDARARSRGFVELLRGRGYQVAGGEVHDGTGWSSYKNRTDLLLEALFPPVRR